MKYKYIWKDEEKKNYIAIKRIVWINSYYNVSFLNTEITQVDNSFIENEPTLWEKIN